MSRARLPRMPMTDLPVRNESWVRRILRRNLASLIGLGILVAIAAAIVALASWHVDDPSLSNSVDRSAANLLAYPGAVFADLVMQFLGVAAPLLLIPSVVWGWHLVAGKDLRFRRGTLFAWVGGMVLAAAAAGTLPIPERWPLPTGLGGVTGDLVLRAPSALGGPIAGWTAVATGLLFAAVAAGLLFIAMGFSRRRSGPAQPVPRRRTVTSPPLKRRPVRPAPAEPEFDDEGEGGGRLPGLILGAIAHTGYRLKSVAGRLLRRHDSDDAGSARSPLFRVSDIRREPVLTALETPFDDETADLVPADEVEDPAPAPAGARPRRRRPATKRKADGVFELPPLDLLATPRQARHAQVTPATLEENARLLESVLDDFGIRGEIIQVRPGPVVTLYELEPAPGVKSSRVISLADDIARSMSAIACRVAVIPGKNAIGIELPNDFRETVFLRELLASKDSLDTKARLPLCLGKTIGGEPVIADLSRMPHLLIAGTTGSGKSVSINTMILSLLYRLTPSPSWPNGGSPTSSSLTARGWSRSSTPRT